MDRKTIILAIGLLVALITSITYMAIYSRSPSIVEGVSGSKEKYITITDDLNRTVAIMMNPGRIVSTMRIITSFLLQFNIKDKLVGADISVVNNRFYEKCCPWIKNVTIVATGKRNINLEQILALKPDVVFAKTYQRNLLMEIESKVPIVYLDLETPEKFMHDLELVGKILGQEDRALDLREYYNSILGMIENRTKNVENKPITLFIYYAGPGKYNVPPTHWLQYHMIKTAGGKPPRIRGSGWVEVNTEQIIEWNPDIVFVVMYRGNSVEAARNITLDKALADVNAVKNNRVYPIPSDGEPWDMPTPKWILCTLYMAKNIHPELFKDLNITEATIEFYIKVYGVSRSIAVEMIPEIIRG